MKQIVSAILLCCASHAAFARDVHVLPKGQGTQDGSGWDNALGQTALASWSELKLQPGDKLQLGSGEYRDVTLEISSGGKANAPVTIEGVDTGSGLPVFRSNWKLEKPDKGETAIVLGAGASHLTLRHLRIQAYCVGIRTSSKESSPRQQLVFEDIAMDHLRHGFYMSDCADLTLKDCQVRRYSKHGYRLEQGCSKVSLSGCIADCSEGDTAWEKKTELFPFGFLVNEAGKPNVDIVFKDCVAANNLMPLQTTSYKNGDGFVVEANASNVVFQGCRALRNQDGGYDLKVKDVKLTDCRAIGNSRNFRIWTTGTLTNCYSGQASTGLWSNGGPLLIQRSTFYNIKGGAIQTDDESKAPVTLKDCILAKVGEPHVATAEGKAVIDASNVIDTTPKADTVKFTRPSVAWDGKGDAMDSQAFPAKGYRGK